jgi:hypothetical protein
LDSQHGLAPYLVHETRNEFPVLAILEDSALDAAMPKWEEMVLTWEELCVLPTRWKSALKVIAILPGAGTLYQRSPVRGVRRVYLRKSALHLYYTFDDDEVIVRALWGAHRERGPQL